MEKWLLNPGKNGKLERLAVVEIAKQLYPREVEMLGNLTCPFCGAVFTLRTSLRRHLGMSRKMTECRARFKNMVDHILETYVDFMDSLKILKYHGRRRYRLTNSEGVAFKFKHITEAATFYVNNYAKVKVIW